MTTAGASKANMSAGEIDPGNAAAPFEIRRGIKARIGEIGGLLERSAGENGYTIKPPNRARENEMVKKRSSL
jgi:hypothetical protein